MRISNECVRRFETGNGVQGYDKVRKVYSINIVYFSLGHGKDFVYHGKTEFVGIHEEMCWN